MSRKSFFLILFICFTGYFLQRAPDKQQLIPLTNPYPMPPFTLNDLEANKRAHSEWAGSIIVLNFWATWCPPCREEIPDLIRLQKDFAALNVQVLGIAVDEQQPTKSFARLFGINYPVLMDKANGMELSLKYGNALGAIPYTVIINPSGNVAFEHSGTLSYAELSATLTKLSLESKKLN